MYLHALYKILSCTQTFSKSYHVLEHSVCMLLRQCQDFTIKTADQKWVTHVKGDGVVPGVIICSCLKAALIWLTGVLGSSCFFSADTAPAPADSLAGRALAAPGVAAWASPLGPAGSFTTAAEASPRGLQPAELERALFISCNSDIASTLQV